MFRLRAGDSGKGRGVEALRSTLQIRLYGIH
jgi:hypothetical protein